MRDATSWPARAYAYGTWGYALARAREHAQERHQRVYLYRGALDGEPVWVAAWDPKPTRVTTDPTSHTADREALVDTMAAIVMECDGLALDNLHAEWARRSVAHDLADYLLASDWFAARVAAARAEAWDERLVDDVADRHLWGGGYFCSCGHELNSPQGFTRHVVAALRAVVSREPGERDKS